MYVFCSLSIDAAPRRPAGRPPPSSSESQGVPHLECVHHPNLSESPFSSCSSRSSCSSYLQAKHIYLGIRDLRPWAKFSYNSHLSDPLRDSAEQSESPTAAEQRTNSPTRLGVVSSFYIIIAAAAAAAVDRHKHSMAPRSGAGTILSMCARIEAKVE